jgi:hypothetical protein
MEATEPRRLRKKSYRSPELLGMSAGLERAFLYPRSGFHQRILFLLNVLEVATR